MCNTSFSKPKARSTALSFIYFLLFLVIGIIIGQSGSLAYVKFCTNYSTTELSILLQEGKLDLQTLLFLQAFGSFFTFIAPIIAWVYISERETIKTYFSENNHTFNVGTILFLIILFVVSMPVIGQINQWNMSITFPESLKWFDDYARAKEEEIALQMKSMVTFSTPFQMIAALFVMAVIPAVGEELLFRGVLQKLFQKTFKNEHVGIWLAGFLFSAIHFQFFGFFPRWLLGVVFGYYYLWSRNLIVPIIAHFINNGLLVVAYYLYNTGAMKSSPESIDQMNLSVSIFSFLLFGFGLYQFKKYNEQNSIEIENTIL